ncbi:TIS1421-transposase protein A [Chloroflexus aurantiacus J-10-fl]|jgi:transposase|uniref:TIS1421-transposase protein A n=1 Tax=Chloroflexus aurantiacus (strain ATCC 29366 / DSM 635 / J-10-fl) TaxID=324602 RepID=A9WAT3_CHLAA|nr:TIS1421-transposase protein A [Chloroflexus aurantiacus J-10-fl]
MSRHDLTDDQWVVIEPLIPKQPRARGRPRNDDRRTLNGMLYVLHTGCAWADLPTEDESPSTCWRRWHAWSQDGTWERMCRTLLSRLAADGTLAWARALLDGSVVPATKGALAEAQRRLATAPR